MKLKNFLAIILSVTISVAALAGCGKGADNHVSQATGNGETNDYQVAGDDIGKTEGITDKSVTLNFWYTDAGMTEYFTYAVGKYQADHPGITINLNMAASTGYLENINTQSIKQTNAVDVYMLHNADLEQAYLAGLANVYDPADTLFNTENFGNSAIRAVTYGGKQVAYPLYFDSAFLIYNKAYVTAVPKTFDDIKNSFGTAADGEGQSGEATETTEANEELGNMEKTFVWPVSDYTFNYAFLSDAFTVGGINGDDRNQINTSNETVLATLTYFHDLYDFYAINRKEVDYESCIEDFIAGKTAFTMAKTGMVKTLNESGVDYGTACMPDISETIMASSLSYTQTLVINPYSLNIDVAEDFVKKVTCEYVDRFYEMTEYYPSYKNWNHGSEIALGIYDNYNDSTPRPKMMTLGDYYIELEILLHKVWDADGDVATLLAEFQNFIATQVQY